MPESATTAGTSDANAHAADVVFATAPRVFYRPPQDAAPQHNRRATTLELVSLVPGQRALRAPVLGHYLANAGNLGV